MTAAATKWASRWGSLGVGLAMLAGCGGEAARYEVQFAKQPVVREAAAKAHVPKFLVVSDTQFAIPFTDYDLRYRLGKQVIDLPPELSTLAARSFYRNAEAHLTVALAFESLVAREKQNGYGFGLFGGDMVEFSCKNESQQILDMLVRQKLPFIITIGNHDAVFHGSIDTDAVSRGGRGEWDLYSYALWGNVCEHAGGRLTKSGFIEQVLDYYAKAWELDVRDYFQQGELAKEFPKAGKLPRAKPYAGVVTNKGWQLEFEFELSFEEGPESHRQSHLYQRFTRLDPTKSQPTVAFTSLDTTDYRTRPALCDSESLAVNIASHLVQIGMGGAISSQQVGWLEHRPKLDPSVPHFVLSHYLPFQDVEGLSSCDATFGTRCLGARLAKTLSGSTYLYGHVHQPFKEGSIFRSECFPHQASHRSNARLQTPDYCRDLGANPLVRLPALIDNKRYVVFDGERFVEKQTERITGLVGEAPFVHTTTTCEQRVYEHVEFASLLRCVKQAGADGKVESCPVDKDVHAATTALAQKLCPDFAKKWTQENKSTWAHFQAPPPAASAPFSSAGVCHGWPESSQWRCILRGLTYNDLNTAAPTEPEKLKLGELLLSAVEPLRGKHEKEPR